MKDLQHQQKLSIELGAIIYNLYIIIMFLVNMHELTYALFQNMADQCRQHLMHHKHSPDTLPAPKGRQNKYAAS